MHPTYQWTIRRRSAMSTMKWMTNAVRDIAISLLWIFANAAYSQDEIRVGIIGLDTSHAPAFTRLLNATDDPEWISGAKVVAAVAQGSHDIESSVSRVPEYTTAVKKYDVRIVDTVETLVAQVDAVLLESNDGRVHLEQVVPVLAAGKPVFIDKPIAGSLVDTLVIFTLADYFNTPVFSSSSLRFASTTTSVRDGAIGEVLGCDTFSPCLLEKTHPDLFWYGIHGIESLFTVMGSECKSVIRTSTKEFDQVTGVWSGGRIGTFRGMRQGKRAYGGTAFGTKGVMSVGNHDGYRPLLLEIISFFKTGKSPVSMEETTAIYAFMEAADQSKQSQKRVTIADVLKKASQSAKPIVARQIAGLKK